MITSNENINETPNAVPEKNYNTKMITFVDFESDNI
jgi:hypothetical protein